MFFALAFPKGVFRNSRVPCCADVGTVMKFSTITNFLPLMFTHNIFVYSNAALPLLKSVCVLHQPDTDKIAKVFKQGCARK